MSRTRVFVYVEGRDLDPYFYSKICGPVCEERNVSYEVIVADRISGGGGGKGKLTRFFEYLRSKGTLVDRSGPDAKLTMFYLDKDADNILRRLRRSPHVVYTAYFSVENYLFREAELIAGIASAISVGPAVVRNMMPDCASWCANAVELWGDWIAICLLAQRLKVGGEFTYGINHADLTSRVNPGNIAACIADLEAQSGLTPSEFARNFRWAERQVQRSFVNNQHDSLFKGKWYQVFAQDLFERLNAAHGPVNLNGAGYRLVGSLQTTLDFEANWTEHFRDPLRVALATL